MLLKNTLFTDNEQKYFLYKYFVCMFFEAAKFVVFKATQQNLMYLSPIPGLRRNTGF